LPAAAPPETGETKRQLTRFLVIGSASVAFDFVVYVLLTAGGLPRAAGKLLSYVAGMLVGFAGNKFWTFRSARRSLGEPLSYALLYALTLCVNVGVNALALAVLGAGHTLLAFLAAAGVTTVLNFLGMRCVTFRRGVRERLASVRRGR
jgi:putative flippase GtrA